MKTAWLQFVLLLMLPHVASATKCAFGDPNPPRVVKDTDGKIALVIRNAGTWRVEDEDACKIDCTESNIGGLVQVQRLIPAGSPISIDIAKEAMPNLCLKFCQIDTWMPRNTICEDGVAAYMADDNLRDAFPFLKNLNNPLADKSGIRIIPGENTTWLQLIPDVVRDGLKTSYGEVNVETTIVRGILIESNICGNVSADVLVAMIRELKAAKKPPTSWAVSSCGSLGVIALTSGTNILVRWIKTEDGGSACATPKDWHGLAQGISWKDMESSDFAKAVALFGGLLGETWCGDTDVSNAALALGRLHASLISALVQHGEAYEFGN